MKQTCLEPATLNIKLNPLKDGAMTKGDPAFVLFNDNRSKAELFLPDSDRGIVLKKTHQGNWKNKDFLLISWKGYAVQRNGKAVFGGE